jgi:hypothetical protein
MAMATLRRHLLRSISHKCPPAHRRAARRKAITWYIHYKMAALSVFRTHLVLRNRRQYRTPRVSTAQTRPPVLRAHQSNTLQQIHLVPPTVYQYTTTLTAPTRLSHPAPPTAPPSPQRSTALQLLYQHICPLPRPHPCVSRRRHHKCRHRSYPTLFPRLRNTMGYDHLRVTKCPRRVSSHPPRV